MKWRALRALFNRWRALFGVAEDRSNEGVDLFLLGNTVPKISALLNPGLGGPPLLQAQRDLEQDIRSYAVGLEQEIQELKQQLADMREAQRKQAAAAAAAAAQQPGQAPEVDPGALLGELLGIGA